MESKVVHKQLRDNTPGARNMLICYLQYLIDYRRDVPEKEEYIVQEFQGLASTQYVEQLDADDPIFQLLHVARQLDEASDEQAKGIWSKLRNAISDL